MYHFVEKGIIFLILISAAPISTSALASAISKYDYPLENRYASTISRHTSGI